MRTSEEIYHRVRWDPRFDPARFVLGINQHGACPKRMPLHAFVPGGDIPWHRVLFVEADGELIWDRATGLDRIDTCHAGRVRETRRLPAPFFTPSTPYTWNPATGWCPADTDSHTTGPAPTVVRVLTWNTLWDRFDADRLHTHRRRPLLLAAVSQADADVIALQEVEAALLAMLLRADWVRAGYTMDTDPAGDDIDSSGLLLLSRLPIREAGRHFLGPHKAMAAISVETASGPLVVATTHLTSNHTQNGPDRRRAELDRLAQGLAGVEGHLVLLGDFNDGDDGPKGPAASLGLHDAWTQAHEFDDQRPTFDPRVNPLAAISSLTGKPARLDRILVRPGGPGVTRADLCGDSPTEGLYVSDHYGVQAELNFGETTGGDVLDVPPTARTAMAWIPPRKLWPTIQEIRQRHDPQVRRWPPHVNVLFGFVPEADFERAAPLLAEVAAQTPAFTARIEGVHTFTNSTGSTVWLDPAAADKTPWIKLHQALKQRFPRCEGRAEGFTPHLTLGRSPQPQRFAEECAARLGRMSTQVGELVLLSRRGDEPMRPRATITLGTSEIRWLPVTGPGEPTTEDPARQTRAQWITQHLSKALSNGVVHVVGSRAMGCPLADADLDLVVALPGVADLAEIQARVMGALPTAARVRQVTGARVPGLRLRVDDLDVDLTVVATGALDPTEAVTRRIDLGEAAAIALSAASDADAIRAATSSCRAAFTRLARQVKAWAQARGLDSAPFGGLPGIAWALMSARTAREAGDLPAEDLLRRFFATWAGWDWRNPISLTEGVPTPQAPVMVLTPTEPVRLCSEQVGPGLRDLLTEELYQAWEILEAATENQANPWPQLLAPPALHRRHAAWAVLTVSSMGSDAIEQALGRFRGRLRALLTALEANGNLDTHAWPRPFEASPVSARYAIGLGQNPPGASQLAELAGGWARGLSEVEITWAECGAVPILR